MILMHRSRPFQYIPCFPRRLCTHFLGLREYCTKAVEKSDRILPNRYTAKFISIECLRDQGFPAELHPYKPWELSNDEAFAHALALQGRNVFITGFALTGKTRLAMKIANDIEAQTGKKVVCAAASRKGTFRIKGLFLFELLGMKTAAQDMSREQADSIIDRHMRQVDDKLYGCLPTFKTIDVLIIDDAYCVTLKILQAMDSVARRLRPERAGELFGGIQIVFLANFFSLDLPLDSGYHGFVYQSNFWRELFPPDQQVALRDMSKYGQLVEKAHFGTFRKNDAAELASLGVSTDKIAKADFLDDKRGRRTVEQIFSRHQLSYVFHKRYQFHIHCPFRITDAGGMLHMQGYVVANAGAIGVTPRVSFVPEMIVQFNYGNGSTIEAGDIAIVKEAYAHCVAVELPFKGNQRELVYAMRLRVANPMYPDAYWHITQFPLIPRGSMSNHALHLFHTPTKFVDIDPRWLIGPNTLGQVLSKLDRPTLQTQHVNEFLDRDNAVHEPTKVAFEELYQVAPTEAKRYCRNCKTNIASLNFDEAHWRKCIGSARWCKECSLLVPLPHWESHAERHTLVRCFDCRKILEWRNWEIHRLSCPGMLKEISPDNPYIPVETRSLALAQGHDPKDIHA